MSITLNHSDFQCLQDQLVELKTKNYELAEKHRRGQADFEAAKAKICSLQLKLEEQERDFQVTSTTLRQEIAAVHNNNSTANKDADPNNKDEDYKAKYKKLFVKAKELQQRYEKSIEVVQSMDNQIKSLNVMVRELQEENSKLKESLLDKQEQLDVIEEEHRSKLNSALEDLKDKSTSDCHEQKENLVAITQERDKLRLECDRLTAEVKQFDLKLASQVEERKIQERKGIQMVKDLKRQLATERGRCETLQKRLETVMNDMIPSNSSDVVVVVNHTATTATTTNASNSSDIDIRAGRSSDSSSTNGTTSNNGSSSNGTGGGRANNNQDTNSVSSWSLVPNNINKMIKSSNQALCESLSICSIDSEDRETVQQQQQHQPPPSCDTSKSDSSLLPISTSSQSTSRQDLSHNNSPRDRFSLYTNMLASNYYYNIDEQSPRRNSSSMLTTTTNTMDYNNDSLAGPRQMATTSSGMSIDEQAALMERLTRLQHDKWTLEEKLSYMEQANVSLTQDLANKSDIIKNYFMDQALRSAGHSQHSGNMDATGLSLGVGSKGPGGHRQHRRTSLSNNVNQLLSEKPSLKKVVDFLKERSQVSSSESESLTREAAKKMQIMLEETLIKCLKLQENLDLVTSDLNKLEHR